MNTQIVRSAIRATSSASASGALPFRTLPRVRNYTQASSPAAKTITLFGKEYSRKRVYTVGGLILLADVAIFDYYYFFADKKAE